MSENNFWGDENVDNNINNLKSDDTQRNAPKPVRKIEFDWWWVLAAVFVVIMVVVAVILNTNHDHGGDDASNISGSIKIDNGDQKINWERYAATDVNLSDIDGSYTITTSGTYNLTGDLKDGAVIVKATSEDVVRLILKNVTIINSSGPAIVCYSGDDLVIELEGENYLEDGEKYSSDWDDSIDGAIYSKSDLSFSGDGILTLVSNYQDGIVGKDDLTFRGGTYKVTSADDGIRGKDSVHIENGDFNIKSTADAIKSTNDTDTTKGFVLIENGNFAITAGAKGIKATNSILIYNGEFAINSTDDGIHSNNYIGVINGEIEISSGDDGIHADARLIVDGGKVNITKSYEGLEAQKISINGGEISLVTSDDGINAGGGSDSSAMNRTGAGAFDVDENCELIINGGTLYVNTAGDGLDSNGAIYINGGTVVVDGPTSNGDGALDSGSDIIMTGGSVIAIGSSGMAETLGNKSSIYNISVYLSSTQAKGTKIEIKNPNGDTILSHTSAKTFSHIAAGASDFKSGETYKIYLNGTEYTSFTISDITTVVGNSNNGFQNMNNAGRGQR